MKVITVKRTISLGEGSAMRHFPIGTHQAPDEICTGWFFEALKKDGDLIVAESDEVEVKETGNTENTGSPDLLAGTAKDVIKMLGEITIDDAALLALLEKEQAEKNRNTVVAKLTEMIEARG